MQKAGETYDQYRTALRNLAESCDFQTITPDKILRDKLVFGIRDDVLLGSSLGSRPSPYVRVLIARGWANRSSGKAWDDSSREA